MTYYVTVYQERAYSVTMTLDRQAFKVGESVYIKVRVSERATRVPVDPTNVQLLSVTQRSDDTDILGGAVAFTQDGVGDYSYELLTAGYNAPDTYDLLVKVDNGVSDVVLEEDFFVLGG